MNKSAVKTFARFTGYLTCSIVGAFAGAISAPMGGVATGLPKGGFGWQFIPYMLCGGVLGLGVAVAALTFARASRWPVHLEFIFALIAPPLVASVAAAIITPVMIWKENIDDKNRQQAMAASKAKYQAFYEQLRRDPEIALRDKWYHATDQRYGVFEDSFADPTIPYTLELLKRFYSEAPASRDVIFINRACDTAFLTEHFREAWDRAANINYGMLACIVSNPKTPRNLIYQVATSKTLPGGAVDPARRALGLPLLEDSHQ